MKKLMMAATALLALNAYAEQDAMKALDTDKDGKVSVEEAAKDAGLAAVFAKLDSDQDGYLTASEMAKRSD
ncbi:EF-hand domain-containing protein [Aestuariibacter halophilus]|uniref:EF-hand domain-containing protein n=1 Tax=Fluctibacter halophilus TaxID=226011 RepID=A0ABS8G4L6_9ALTE|nr:EF-hand domain-containing protein [Aestuariibacter halophilus]MCC2615539.1 EF-hand domain-containing protein [Aestuariibacter halophilus]